MLFLTLVFITWFLWLLIKGDLLTDSIIKSAEIEIKKTEGSTMTKEDEKAQIKFVLVVLGMLILWVIQVIFLVKAIPIDTYKYPTL